MMQSPEHLQIKSLTDTDLHAVADLHLQAFPDSLLSVFGRETISQFYSWQMVPPNHCHALGVFKDDQLKGFCFAGSLRNAEIYFIQERFMHFFCFFIRHPLILFDKRIIQQIGSTIRNYANHISSGDWKRSKQAQVKRDIFGILSIAVDSHAQRSGLGRLLIDEVEKIAFREDVDKLYLTVHPENIEAVSFYEKTGWVRVTNGDHWKGQMKKELIEI